MQSKRTIKSLNLDMKAAEGGRTWLLLPGEYRDPELAAQYPLPSTYRELQLVANIYVPPQKNDSGVIYIKRAIAAWKERQKNKSSIVIDLQRRTESIQRFETKYRGKINELSKEAKRAVDEVKAEATKAIASLNHLFDLGRRGIEGQMQAYLDGAEFNGEKIDGDAFRQCFRLVTQAVKGLGTPSTEREIARQTILEQAAEAIRETQEAIALAPGPDDETEH